MKTIRILVLVLLLVLAANAFGGSWFLIRDPSGKSIGIPLELLEGTPFDDYLIPGIILFAANGVLSILVVFLTVTKAANYPWFIVFQGCILIGWLTGELLLNKAFFHPFLHYSLYTIGVAFVVSGFILKRRT